jgi:hypothetical protein
MSFYRVNAVGGDTKIPGRFLRQTRFTEDNLLHTNTTHGRSLKTPLIVPTFELRLNPDSKSRNCEEVDLV